MSHFVALWPDREVRAALADATARLVTDDQGRQVPPDQYHLTLAFLGEVGPASLDRLAPSLAKVGSGPFVVTVVRTGWFERARVGWLGPETTPSLSALRDSIGRVCRDAGAAPAPARFIPHVSVVRDRRVPLPPWTGPEVVWQVDGFALCRSDAGRYRIVERYPLGGAP